MQREHGHEKEALALETCYGLDNHFRRADLFFLRNFQDSIVGYFLDGYAFETWLGHDNAFLA